MAYYDYTKPLFILGTTTSAGLAGAMLANSYFAIPTLLVSTSERNALLQFKTLYALGASTAPLFVLTSALCSFASAYTHYHPQVPSRAWLFAASGALSLAVVPYTLLFMAPTNTTLHEREASASANAVDGKAREAAGLSTETKELLGRWRVLNAVRGLFPLAAALFAFEAL